MEKWSFCQILPLLHASRNRIKSILYLGTNFKRVLFTNFPWNLEVNLHLLRLPCSSNGKESACDAGDQGSIPGLGSSSEEGNGNPLQYSCLENSMDREAWRATIHRVAKSRTRLSDSHTHTHTHNIPFYGYTTFCLSICQLTDIWVVSTFWLWWIMMLLTFIYVFVFVWT